MFGGNFAPRGTMLCEGQLLSIQSNTALFSNIGTTFGGDGQTTFALPDLRGRMPRCSGASSALGRTLVAGEQLGGESAAISVAQLPAHTHALVDGEVTGVAGGGAQTLVLQSPQLVVNCEVRVAGIFPSRARKRDLAGLLGEIRYSATLRIRTDDFLPLAGQELQIALNTALFSLFGCVRLRVCMLFIRRLIHRSNNSPTPPPHCPERRMAAMDERRSSFHKAEVC